VALYTEESKERVRDAVDMADLVGTRTELRRAGVNRLQGLCPFHDERTPSFGIDPQSKLFYCFGCGEGGDAFRFVELTEGLDFKGALEFLADRYGVQLELARRTSAAAEQRRRRERLLEVLERTAAFYVRYLWESDEAAPAREYLAGRGLEEGILREFRVGYAPSAWDKVLLASRRAGFSDRELWEAGLAQRARGEGRTFDRFRRPDHVPAVRRAGAGAGLRRTRRRRRAAAEVPELRRGPGLPQGPSCLRCGSRAGARDARRDRRAGRGLHGRDRDAPGRAAQHRGVDGHRPDRGAGRRARPPGGVVLLALDADSAGRRRCCARRAWRRAGGWSCGWSSCPRAAIRPISSGARARGRCGRSSRRPCRSCDSGCSASSTAAT
jgi:hypothetical protein